MTTDDGKHERLAVSQSSVIQKANDTVGEESYQRLHVPRTTGNLIHPHVQQCCLSFQSISRCLQLYRHPNIRSPPSTHIKRVCHPIQEVTGTCSPRCIFCLAKRSPSLSPLHPSPAFPSPRLPSYTADAGSHFLAESDAGFKRSFCANSQ